MTMSQVFLRSPYAQAWQWIEQHPGTGSAKSLAKLLLSLWNHSNGFSFRECIENLDEDRTRLALRIVSHFATHGEDRELGELGQKVCAVYPHLCELGQAATQAKRELREKWRLVGAQAKERS